MDKRLLQSWLKAGYLEEGVFFDTEEGTPQGGIISPTLANMALDGLEGAARKALPRRGAKVNVVRYADDFIITGVSKELLEEKVLPSVRAFLLKRGLRLSEEKTSLRHIKDGFDFLGFTIRKYGEKLLIKPSGKSIRRFMKQLRELIKRHLGSSVDVLIRVLNARLRGWGQYYRHVVSKRVFARLDKAILDQLYRWMRRRHPGRGVAWLRQRYFRWDRSRWVFSARPSKKVALDLFLLGDIAIRRHIKVQSMATPFDPGYATYFKHRRLRPKVGLKPIRHDLYEG